MSVSAAAILSVLLSHPSWTDRHATPEQRRVALEPVAIAIAEASRDRGDAAMLVALGLHESGFATGVVHGVCRKGECDGGRARGAWQLHAAACREAYAFDAGTEESIAAEARCAIRQLRYHGFRCRDHALSPMVGGFSGYATGGASCHWLGAEARARTTRRIVVELRRVEGSS